MELEERFQKLSALRQLSVAAAAAHRVLPIFVASADDEANALRDGIDMVTLASRGRAFSQVEYTRAINAVTALAAAKSAPTARAVCTAVTSALEAASHNRAAALTSLDAARRAVEAFADDSAAAEELQWQIWAVSQAATSSADAERPLSGADAPTTSWRANLQRDLPLFERNRDA